MHLMFLILNIILFLHVYDKVKTVLETVISQLHSVFTAVFQKLCWLTDSNC